MILFLKVLGGLVMRLKVLPPTLRKNNRYLTLDIKSVSELFKDDLVNIIWDNCVRFQGECSTANFNLWVMKFYEIERTDEYFHYKSIIRCQRDYSMYPGHVIQIFLFLQRDASAPMTSSSKYGVNRISMCVSDTSLYCATNRDKTDITRSFRYSKGISSKAALNC